MPRPSIENVRKQLLEVGTSNWKQRSHDTHLQQHVPEIVNTAKDSNEYLLIGDSMLERFKTTGSETRFASFPHFNAGCGGDRVENLLYRCSMGLLERIALSQSNSLRVIVIHIGTNNVHKKRGLSDAQLDNFKILFYTILDVFPNTRVVSTGLFHRNDISSELMNRCNSAIEDTVACVNASLEKRSLHIEFIPAPLINPDDHLEDGVHLNTTGYQVWSDHLCAKLEQI